MPSTVLYSPMTVEAVRNRARRVVNPLTGNSYQLDALGSAAMDNADVPYFSAAEEFAPIPTAGSGQVVLRAHFVQTSAYARNITHPTSGNQYLVNQQGYVVVSQADAPYFQTQGFTIPTGTAAVFPPLANGAQATIAADFVGQQYWAPPGSPGQTYPDFTTWLTAVGGTYARASSATYLDRGVLKTALSNIVRFPTDNSGTPQGIRLTGAVTNLLLQSTALSTAPWTLSGGTVTPGQPSPDGGATAFLCNDAGVQGLRQVVTVLASTTYCLSAFIKKTASDPGYTPGIYAFFSGGTAVNTIVVINPFTGVVTASTTGGAPLAFGAIDCGTYWLLWQTVGSGNNTTLSFRLYPNMTASGAAAAGSATFWGPQLTASAFLQDYVPTTTVAATQAADNLNFPYTQTTFSARVDHGPLSLAGNSRCLGGQPSPNVPMYFPSAAAYRFTTQNAASSALVVNVVGTDFTVSHKSMVAGSPSGRAGTSDGANPISDGNAIAGSLATMYVGSENGGSQVYGNFQYLALWNGVAASAAEMIRLTGGGAAPSWLPQVGSTYASIYADFGIGNYWYNGQRANFSAWLTALGGTFTRASSATYIDANGVLQTVGSGVARVTPQGIRLTGAVTNNLVRSSEFDNGAAWAGNNITVTPNTTVAPDGTTTADTLAFNPNLGLIAQNYISGAGSKTFTFSIWLKGNAGDTVGMRLNDANAGATQAVQAVTLTGAWARYVLTGTLNISVNTVTASLDVRNAVVPGTGGGPTLQAWGAQLEVSAFAGDYVPTTTVAATQAADSLQSAIAWYNAAASTLQIDFSIDNPGNAGPSLAAFWDNGVNQNIINLAGAAVGSLGLVMSGGVSQWGSLSGPAVVAGARTKVAIALTANSFSYSKNNGLPFLTQASGAMPIATGMNKFGVGSSYATIASGNFFGLAYWGGVRATDAELRSITT